MTKKNEHGTWHVKVGGIMGCLQFFLCVIFFNWIFSVLLMVFLNGKELESEIACISLISSIIITFGLSLMLNKDKIENFKEQQNQTNDDNINDILPDEVYEEYTNEIINNMTIESKLPTISKWLNIPLNTKLEDLENFDNKDLNNKFSLILKNPNGMPLSKTETEYYLSTVLNYDLKLEKAKEIIRERLGDDCYFLEHSQVNKKMELLKQLNETKEQIAPIINLTPDELHKKIESVNFQPITKYIEAKLSGEKGKLYFKNSTGSPCSTEAIVLNYFKSLGYKVIRAEVALWQVLFCICYFEEIYAINWDGISDIPFDLFLDNLFYNLRARIIENKYNKIKNLTNLKDFINSQIEDFGFHRNRLLYPKSFANIEYCKTPLVQEFFEKVDIKHFALITYEVAKNISKNRAGLPDYIVWNDIEMLHIEVKREKEKLRQSQIDWISYLRENNIPVQIYRVKGIKSN